MWSLELLALDSKAMRSYHALRVSSVRSHTLESRSISRIQQQREGLPDEGMGTAGGLAWPGAGARGWRNSVPVPQSASSCAGASGAERIRLGCSCADEEDSETQGAVVQVQREPERQQLQWRWTSRTPDAEQAPYSLRIPLCTAGTCGNGGVPDGRT